MGPALLRKSLRHYERSMCTLPAMITTRSRITPISHHRRGRLRERFIIAGCTDLPTYFTSNGSAAPRTTWRMKEKLVLKGLLQSRLLLYRPELTTFSSPITATGILLLLRETVWSTPLCSLCHPDARANTIANSSELRTHAAISSELWPSSALVYHSLAHANSPTADAMGLHCSALSERSLLRKALLVGLSG